MAVVLECGVHLNVVLPVKLVVHVLHQVDLELSVIKNIRIHDKHASQSIDSIKQEAGLRFNHFGRYFGSPRLINVRARAPV
jgi:hypothetical protein